MLAIVLTGPPGSGKSSVMTVLSDALSDDDVAHAAIEVEALVWAHPPLADAQRARHLRAAVELYRQAGHDLILVAQTLENDGDVADLLAAVGAEEHFLVRLEAPPATLAQRITDREPPSWSGLPGLVAHAQALATSMAALSGVALVLSTEGRSADDVAARIRAVGPHQLRPPARASRRTPDERAGERRPHR